MIELRGAPDLVHLCRADRVEPAVEAGGIAPAPARGAQRAVRAEAVAGLFGGGNRAGGFQRLAGFIGEHAGEALDARKRGVDIGGLPRCDVGEVVFRDLAYRLDVALVREITRCIVTGEEAQFD